MSDQQDKQASAQTPYQDASKLTTANQAATVAAQRLPDCDSLLKQVTEYSNQVTLLGDTLKTYSQTSDEATALIENQKNFIQTLLASKAGTQDANTKDLLAQLELCTNKTAALQKQIDELNAQIAALQNQIDATKGDANPLQQKVNQLVALIKTHEDSLTQIAQLQARIDLESNIVGDESQAKMETLKAQLTDRENQLKQKVETAAKELADAKAQLEQLQKNIAEMQAKLDDCLATKQNTDQKIVEEGSKQSDIQKQLNDCQAREQAVVTQYKEFCDSQSNTLQKYNQSLTALIASVSKPLTDLKNSVEQARSALVAAEGAKSQ